MANTTNFGWETPDDTDLVKDGAAAMRTLGNAIDASFVDLKGGTSGQILSKNSNTDLDYVWITNDVGDITGVTATSPLTGGGTSGAVTVGIQDGTTAQKGAVQLEDSTSSTSTTKAATPNSVKTSFDLANAAIPKSLVDAKGDLVSASADNTPAILTVGNNGETLLADSAATTGLRWAGNYAAGKNAIINGDFRINQRAFTSVTTNAVYCFDRWMAILTAGGGTVTFTPETFTVGSAPVAGYEAINYLRIVTASQTGTDSRGAVEQRIEDVRAFAGQTITVSFWAKAGSGTPNIVPTVYQVFGSGGSADVTTAGTKKAISTSWARYSFNITVPSISGKTIGTGSYLRIRIFVSAGSDLNSQADTLGIQNGTFDIWGVQVEAGSVATAFQTATGTLAAELAACQRYYYRKNSEVTGGSVGVGQCFSTTQATISIPHPVTMRTTPTLARSGLSLLSSTGTRSAVSAISNNGSNVNTFSADFTTTGIVAGNATILCGSGTSTTDYIEASAEL